MTLNDLEVNQTAKIKQIKGNGLARRRLLDLGIHVGETVRMIRSAPLKDPLEIALRNGHITIRRSEASLIEIEPLIVAVREQ